MASSDLTNLFGDQIIPYTGPNTFGTINYPVPAQGTRYIFIQRQAGTFFIDALAYSICIADTDNDGIADRNDLDDDNDGIPDLIELTDYTSDPGADDDIDGLLNYLDTNAPGFIDDNFDGVDDRADNDGDGIPNHLDLDSDNDGIVDIVEANEGVLPANASIEGRYVASYAIANDTDGDGLVNDVDGTPLTNPDFDGDGLVDIFDVDSDNDGITDLVEAGGVDIDGNGRLDNFEDTDGDGLGNAVDPDSGGSALPILNSDNNGNPDYFDTDSDDDGIADIIEGHDANLDGIAEWDANGNEVLDVGEGTGDADGDGLLDVFDRDVAGEIAALPDSDNDGLFNYQDADDDEDGTPTSAEDANGNGNFADDFSQGQGGINQGIPDYLFNGFTVLPVELISFEGKWIDNTVQLDWQTATEISNDRFEIQRSSNGNEFKTIGTVKGNGNSIEVIAYEFSDRNPLRGTSFYRLKQFDFDGAFEYSEVIKVESEVNFERLELQVYPNPKNSFDDLNIRFTSFAPEFPVNISVLDTNGAVMKTLESVRVPGDNVLTIGADELQLKSGIYLIQVEQQGKRSIYRFIVL